MMRNILISFLFIINASAYSQTVYTQNRQEAMRYLQKAEMQKRGGNFNNAVLAYTNAIEINPRYVEALFNRGLAYYKDKKQFDKACPDWKLICELGSCETYKQATKNGDCE